MTSSRIEVSNPTRVSAAGVIIITICLGFATASPAQTLTTLLSFDSTGGRNPQAPVVQGRDGNLYGTTLYGGTKDTSACNENCGTVFKMTPAGTLTTLYSFCSQSNCADGAVPQSGLVLGTDGNFYGTTLNGGTQTCTFLPTTTCGTVFKITPAGTLTTLYSFCSQTNCLDGALPSAKLVLGTDGNFYGTTSSGGGAACNNEGCGTIFKITPTGTLTTLFRFPGSLTSDVAPDGATPSALIQANDGNFYGTTSSGGGHGGGTVFKVTSKGKLTTLHRFCSYGSCSTDGYGPAAGLVQGSDGNFYGTTSAATTKISPTFFRITPAGTLTTLFEGLSKQPLVALIQATDGNFYGTTYLGVQGSTVFQITPSGTRTTLYTFCTQPNCTDGASYPSELMQGTDGNLYGTTEGGGNAICGGIGCGTIYSLSMNLRPFVTFVRNSGKVGQTAEVLGQGFTGTTGVSFNGTPATFTVRRDTYLTAVVPAGAATGTVEVTTPSGTLNSNVVFWVTP